MPSIQDVADQVNAKLDTISTNTSDTATNTAAIQAGVNTANAKLGLIDNHLQLGFSNLSHGIFALVELEKVSVALAEQNRKQNDTIICLLENSNEMLCGITRKLTRQLDLSERILSAAARLVAIEERVHAAEAADYDRFNVLQDEIRVCCPPPKPPIEPCPAPCPKSDYVPTRPNGQDWTPLPTQPKGGPTGETR
jgi:hypothetical protein